MSDKITISFLKGTQLMCRKPAARCVVSCQHPPWWQFWKVDHCGAVPPMLGVNLTREEFTLDDSACHHARWSVQRLPSYKSLEKVDRLTHPEATPCDCKH